MPVIHRSTKPWQTVPNIPRLRLQQIQVKEASCLLRNSLKRQEYKRFRFTKQASPTGTVRHEERRSLVHGDEHNESGHISEETLNRRLMMEKRKEKLNLLTKKCQRKRNSTSSVTRIQKISCKLGSPKGAIVESLTCLGRKASAGFMQLRMLNRSQWKESRVICGSQENHRRRGQLHGTA
jgi:pyruvate/2-oxoacid:ferredoxin oxidoreductase alpha subunit